MSELAPKIQQRILSEILSRSWSYFLPQIPLVLLFFLFAPWLYSTSILFQISVAFIAIGTVVFSLPIFFDRISIIDLKKEAFLQAGTLLIGLGWGLNLSSIFRTEGMLSQTSLITTIIFCGVHAGTFVLFCIHRSLLYLYLVPASLLPISFSLTHIHSLQELTITLLIIIYNLFLGLSAPIIRRRNEESILNEFQLTEERDKVTGLMNAFPGIVSLIDDQLIYQMMNTSGHRIFSGLDIINKPVGFQNDENVFVQIVKDFHSSNKMTDIKEVSLPTPNGQQWYLINLNRLPHPEGWMVVTSILIDDLVKTRQKLELQKTKAEANSRLASLGQMAQGVAHEMNNPLSIILFSAEELYNLARTNQIEPQVFEKMTEKIMRMSQRMAKIVKGLRYFSRDAEKDQIKPTSIQAMFEQALDLQRERIKNHHIELSLEFPDDDIMVECREVQIIQVIMNLLTNAIDATQTHKEKWIKISHNKESDYVDVLMTNSGDTIKEELRQKIFEPFFSTKEVNQGTGLGLSISLGLMQQNGGDLKLISTKPVSFALRLKLLKD